jgi:predicted ester cyclase
LATGKEAPVSVEENMALVRRFFEARANADLDAIDEMLAPDFVVHTKLFPDQQSELSDREAYKRSVTEYFAAFSDVRFLVEDQVAGADKVVTRFSVCGTHDQREIMGVAPTGREASYMTIVIQRIEGGKIAEEWGVGTSISELKEGWVATWQRTEQERIERERIEQELRVARRIQQAALPATVPELEGWHLLLLSASQGGGRRLLRLPPPLWEPAGSGRGRRHRQRRAGGPGHVHRLRHAAGGLTSLGLLFARGGT